MAIITPNVGSTAYNDFSEFSKLSYRCISHLVQNNELIWKLLKYPDSDAWNKPNLTQEEKASLIYSGQEDSSLYHVFMDDKQPDVLTREIAIVRVFPKFAKGINRTVGYVEVAMQVYSHYKINHLTNYQTRIDTIVEELLKVFNGTDVGGLGLMTFDEMADKSSRLYQTGQIPFGGKEIVFVTFSA